MSYGKHHKISMCDKCDEDVGIEYLQPVSFLYKDCNDKSHKDFDPKMKDYKLYYVCPICLIQEKQIAKEKAKAQGFH